MSNDLTGIPSGYRTPIFAAEILFAQGPASAASGERQVVFVMPKTSAGTWTVNKLYGPIANEAEVETGGGAGSPIHRGIRAFLRLNKDARVYAVPYAATSGTTDVAAALDLDIATNATGAGTITLYIAGEQIQVAFSSGDTPTEIGDIVELAINNRTHLPVTASNSAGTVTLTAKIAGISQGNGTVDSIRCYVEITPGVGTTAAFTDGDAIGDTTAGVEGTTTEAANFDTALDTLNNNRKYYIVTSLSDATSLGHLKTHIDTKSTPKRGLRSVGIAANTHTLAAAQTIATGLNDERIQLNLGPMFQSTPDEIAGRIAAIRQAMEQVDPSANFNGVKVDGLVGPYDSANWITNGDDDVEDAIIDGLSPLSTSDDGVRIVHSVTTRSKDSTGNLNDSRASRTVKVSTADKFVDDLLVLYGLRFGQKKFKDDERLANGTVNPNQKQVTNVVRPSNIRSTITQLLRDFEDDHLQEVAASIASLSVGRSATNGGRAVVGLQLHVIDWLDQITTRVAEVSPN